MDDEELKKLLERNFELAQENNEILNKLHRALVWGRIFRILKWVVIIGIAFGAFYFLQPYVDPVFDTIQEIRGATGGQVEQTQQFLNGTTSR